MSKLGFLIILLSLTGCDWFNRGSSSNPPKDIYSAEFALSRPAPVLEACDGQEVVEYVVSKCFKNGIETSISNCQGLIKLPEVFSSPAGIVSTDLLNYKDEVIGQKTFSCEEGQNIILADIDVSCSDSRYIKQNNNGELQCNPYVKQLKPYLISSEHKLYKTPFGYDIESNENTIDYADWFENVKFAGIGYTNRPLIVFNDESVIIKRSFGTFQSSNFITTDKTIEYIPEIGNCLFFSDKSVDCISFEANSRYEDSESISELTNIKKYLGLGCYQDYNNKVYCMKDSNKSFFGDNSGGFYSETTEIEILEGVQTILSPGINLPFCFNKNNQGYCFNQIDTNVENISNKEIISVTGLISSNYFCFITKDSELYCRGQVLNSLLSRTDLNDNTFSFILNNVKDVSTEGGTNNPRIISLKMSDNSLKIGTSSSPIHDVFLGF